MKNHKEKRNQRIFIEIGICIIIFCTFAFLIAPNSPNEVNLSNRLLAPSGLYPFGTDKMGRCVLSRVFYGGYTTLGIVLSSAIFIIIFGAPIGLFMGYHKGRFKFLKNSLLNAFTALPPIAYLLVFIGAWGNSVFTMLIALTFAEVLRVIKLVKAKTEIERQKAYVLCAIASGASNSRIIFKHIFPNLIKEILVFLSLSCAEMTIMITSFSFLGLGLGDDVVDWGNMILQGRTVSMIRPDIMIYPIIFVFLCTFSFNKLAEVLE